MVGFSPPLMTYAISEVSTKGARSLFKKKVYNKKYYLQKIFKQCFCYHMVIELIYPSHSNFQLGNLESGRFESALKLLNLHFHESHHIINLIIQIEHIYNFFQDDIYKPSHSNRDQTVVTNIQREKFGTHCHYTNGNISNRYL